MTKRALFIITLGLLLIGNIAFANIAIDCGKGIDPDSGKITQREFLISSDKNNFNGKPAQDWEIFDKTDKKIQHAKLSKNSQGHLTLTVMNGRSLNPIGRIYTLPSPWGKNIIQAKEKILGGVAGGISVSTLQCLVGEG